ncbi:unnamed protein product [Mucor hiemalis]
MSEYHFTMAFVYPLFNDYSTTYHKKRYIKDVDIDKTTHTAGNILHLVVVGPKEKRRGQSIWRSVAIHPHEHALLCPVQLYNNYCARVASTPCRVPHPTLRNTTTNALVIAITNPSLALSPERISKHVQDVMRYVERTPSSAPIPKACALGATLAALNGLSMDQIVAHGNWSSRTIFEDLYRILVASNTNFTTSTLDMPQSSLLSCNMVVCFLSGEVKLSCAKRDEHASLLDTERRTPGPSIDATFVVPFLNNVEFFILEISGPPSKDDFEHFIGDRNKMAKNLKLMMKYIISLRTDWRTYKAASLKLFALQIYRNEVYIYSLTSPYDNMYAFNCELKFSLPTLPGLMNRNFPQFMENLWKLKQMIIYSSKCVEHYIMDVESDDDDINYDVNSTLSSPYVSPSKRKETK